MALDPEILKRLNAGEGEQVPVDPDILSRLQAGEGALPEAAPAFAEGETERPKEAEPWYEDFGEGVAVSGMGTYFGLKDLIGLGSEADEKTLADWRKDAGESGWGTTGQVVGEIGQMAVPGGAFLKGAKVASKLKSAKKVAKALPRATKALTGPTATGAASAAAVAGAKTPEAGDTRAGNAAIEAALAVAGGKLTEKVLRGIKKTPDAIAYLRKGGYLTPGMAADSRFISGLEGLLGVLPIGTGKGAARARDRARKEWTENTINEARPTGAPVIKADTGQDAVAQLRKQYDDAYSDAWSKARPSPDAPADVLDAGQRAVDSGLLDETATKALSGAVKQVYDLQPKAFDNVLRRLLKRPAFKDNPDAAEIVHNIRQTFRAGMGDEAAAALRAVDDTYPNYVVVRRAAKNAAGGRAGFSPKDVVNAAKAKSSETAAATGTAPMLRSAQEGMTTVGKSVEPTMEGVWRRGMAGMPSPLTPIMKPAGQLLTGQTPGQKLLSRADEALRRRGLPKGGLLPAYVDTEEF